MRSATILMLLFFVIQSLAFGQDSVRRTVSAEYQGSEDQTPREVKRLAKQAALLKAGQEIFGVYLSSVEKTEMFSLVKRRIFTWSLSKLRVIEEQKKYDGERCRAIYQASVEVDTRDVKDFQRYLDRVFKKSVSEVILEEFQAYDKKDNVLEGCTIIKSNRPSKVYQYLFDGNYEPFYGKKPPVGWVTLELEDRKRRPIKYVVIYSSREGRYVQIVEVYGSQTPTVIDFQKIAELKYRRTFSPQIFELQQPGSFSYIQVRFISRNQSIAELEMY